MKKLILILYDSEDSRHLFEKYIVGEFCKCLQTYTIKLVRFNERHHGHYPLGHFKYEDVQYSSLIVNIELKNNQLNFQFLKDKFGSNEVLDTTGFVDYVNLKY